MTANRFRFRAWDPVVGVLAQAFDLEAAVINGDELYFGHISKTDPPPILMQSTGLLDRNGKEVFEKDIICVAPPHPSYKPKIAIIEFGEHQTSRDYYASSAYGWYAKEVGGGIESETSLVQIFQPIEIIGNIYQNPELLNAGRPGGK